MGDELSASRGPKTHLVRAEKTKRRTQGQQSTECEEKLAELKAIGRHPAPPKDVTVREMFQRVGAGEWDDLRLRFQPDSPTRKAAE